MRKLSIAFFIITFVLLNSVIAQTEIKYAETIEGILNFEDEGKSKIAKLNGSKQISKEIKKRLKLKLKKAEKIKVDYDSITFLTIDVLNDMTMYTHNFSNIFLEIISKNNQINNIASNPNTTIKDLENSLLLFGEINKLTKSFIIANTNLNKKSIILLDRINKFRVRNNLERLIKDKNALNQFYTHYFNYIFKEANQLEELKRARILNLNRIKQNIFKNQTHRFQFINGLLHYNDILLFKGQKLKDVELKLGSDYIETQKPDDKNYRKIRFKNISLSIILDKGIVRNFIIHVLPEKNNDSTKGFDVVDNNFIKLENYYISKDSQSLLGLDRNISKDLDRDCDFSFLMNIIIVNYKTSNDETKELPERHFFILTNSDSKIYRIRYSVSLEN